MLLSLVIPTYNERPSIVPLIQRTTALLEKSLTEFEIIVVDDDSPDRTWEAVQELAYRNGRLKLIRRLDQKDLTTAVLTGWRAGTGRLLGVMDGDLQHPPEVLPFLLKIDSRLGSGHSDCEQERRGRRGERMETVPQIDSPRSKIHHGSGTPQGRAISPRPHVRLFSHEARGYRIRRPQTHRI